MTKLSKHIIFSGSTKTTNNVAGEKGGHVGQGPRLGYRRGDIGVWGIICIFIYIYIYIYIYSIMYNIFVSSVPLNSVPLNSSPIRQTRQDRWRTNWAEGRSSLRSPSLNCNMMLPSCNAPSSLSTVMGTRSFRQALAIVELFLTFFVPTHPCQAHDHILCMS
jgi:hypothetical protein